MLLWFLRKGRKYSCDCIPMVQFHVKKKQEIISLWELCLFNFFLSWFQSKAALQLLYVYDPCRIEKKTHTTFILVFFLFLCVFSIVRTNETKLFFF